MLFKTFFGLQCLQVFPLIKKPKIFTHWIFSGKLFSMKCNSKYQKLKKFGTKIFAIRGLWNVSLERTGKFVHKGFVTTVFEFYEINELFCMLFRLFLALLLMHSCDQILDWVSQTSNSYVNNKWPKKVL